jgi:hypothetical protein
MRDRTAIRERYMRDSVPIRLGGLAANLARIRSFAAEDANREVVEGLVDESKFFIEWTAPEVELGAAADLVKLQIKLARWQRSWGSIWDDPAERRKVAEESDAWAQRILQLSGLSDRTDCERSS